MVEKKQVVSLKRHDKDTGSPEVQISALSDEIKELQAHLALHKKDFDAKRSLLKKVARRRRFMKYLKETNLETYASVAKKLGLKA
jgi:small subunit ribosomal protein S15